jgi:serine/threonine-protein kinase/endoribonuclease IRE1
MPRRRPPVVNNIILLAAAVLLIPWIGAEAQQQQRRSPLEGVEADSLHTLEATKIPPQLETPHTPVRRKNTLSVNNNSNNNRLVKNDASAIATLAPAKSAVALPSARRSTNGGLTSPHTARSLEDWEVEDFVLLATVDGKLYARDRKNGKEKWALEVDKPMVETTYHRRNRSSVDEDYDPVSIDDYLWIVEPSQDGSIYVYRPSGPDPGLVNTGLTMKGLVEESPHYSSDAPYLVYNGKKETTVITIDARNGQVLKWFGSTSALVNNESCLNTNGLIDTESEECSTSATLTIGRTEYTVGIHGKDTHLIATLKFSEWTPNTYDQDLQRQYHTTLDNKYIYTSHDGGVIGFDHDQSGAKQPGRQFQQKFQQKFTSPVVRVFDVARPWGTEEDDPELIVLPQPMPPNQEEDWMSADHRARSIFLNHTEDGSWYAMSGKFYPLAVQGIGPAQCNQQEWQQRFNSWDTMNDIQLSKALVGLHSIDNGRIDRLLTLSPPAESKGNRTEDELPDNAIAVIGPPTLLQRLERLPRTTIDYTISFIQNPLLLVFLVVLLYTYQQQIRVWIGQKGGSKKWSSQLLDSSVDELKAGIAPQIASLPKVAEDETVQIAQVDGMNDDAESGSPTRSNSVTQAEAHIGKKLPAAEISAETAAQDKPPEKEKKRAHRGRRGGVKHKKGGAARATSQDPSLDSNQKPQPTIEEVVRDAQQLGQKPELEPDVRTIPTDPSEVSGPTLRLNNLVVNTEKLIGTGSNGTMVFEGNFDGRAVAVKRMLIQFFDIASQETKLLRESDDHPNVIRYFAQEQGAGFLYIALELCPASLADVIDKPHQNRDLAQAGEKDLPNVLYQITNGLEHLHNLRIVHRDLKPQNILVSMGKDGKPRLLVSDFGLCKKLEGEQSSFRATTAHAAGTSGWRAPELLLDDDANEGLTMVDASTDGNSGSIVRSPELAPNRRATRAIDIFSLGLVFFYVLTKGSHPFDCGDRYMREVNIRKGKFSLANLEVLGDYAFEAKDLISSMLAPDPKLRPAARNVMAHPFFWDSEKRLSFLCDVSDHFEKEIRDPPSEPLRGLEYYASQVCGADFLKPLGKEFVDSLGKQRKYTGTRLLDLLRALRNKKNHYEDMSETLQKHVGALPEGYLSFWTRRFPNLLIICWNVVYDVQWDETNRFKKYYQPAGL